MSELTLEQIAALKKAFIVSERRARATKVSGVLDRWKKVVDKRILKKPDPPA